MLILLVFWLIKPKMSKKNVICVRLIIIFVLEIREIVLEKI